MFRSPIYKLVIAVFILSFSISDLIHEKYLMGVVGLFASVCIVLAYFFNETKVTRVDSIKRKTQPSVNDVLSKLKEGDKIKVMVGSPKYLHNCVVMGNMPSASNIVLKYKIVDMWEVTYSYSEISAGFLDLNQHLNVQENRMDKLEKDLKEALREERYESASVLRDDIKKLKEQESSKKTCK